MYSHLLIVFILLGLTACQNASVDLADKPIESNVAPVHTPISKHISNKKELIESFTDDSKIGIPYKNKISISHFGNSEENLVEVRFYSLDDAKKWKLEQTLEFEKYGSLPIEPELKDFDNDGFMDITFRSSIAARGANDLRKLLIYDKAKGKLITIINSDYYPNLEYNNELDCLDSWMFSGSTSTVFLKIDGSKLREFAEVTDGATRRVYTIDKNGKKTLIKDEKINNNDGFVRYKNFNPVRP